MFRLYIAIELYKLYIRNNYTIYVNTWGPKCTGKRYGSVLKIRPDDGSIEPKHVAALNVF